MRIPRQLLYSALTISLIIASVVLPARAQTQPPKPAGEPSQSQPSIPPPRLPVPMTATGEPSVIRIKKPDAPSTSRPGAVGSCKEQIKKQFADAPNGSRANYELGLCHLSSKKFNDAITAIQKAIQLIPEWIKEIEERVMSSRPILNKEQVEELTLSTLSLIHI